MCLLLSLQPWPCTTLRSFPKSISNLDSTKAMETIEAIEAMKAMETLEAIEVERTTADKRWPRFSLDTCGPDFQKLVKLL